MIHPLPFASPDCYPYGEVRFCTRLLRYWQEKRGIRTMPEESDIDPDELREDWDYCFLLQTRDMLNNTDYNFTYLGAKILAAYYDKALDEYNEMMVGPNAHLLAPHFNQVLTSAAPMFDEGQINNLHGETILYRQILLPLGNSNDEIVAIFGGMRYKLCSEPATA